MDTMNKLIIFDLDGVLINSRRLHYLALNAALEKIDQKFVVTEDEHHSKYDGLSTTKKLELLSVSKGLNKDFFMQIWKDKQRATWKIIDELKPDNRLIEMFRLIKEHDISIAVASNAIRETVKRSLIKIGVMECVDFTVSNQDVFHPKPFPEMYWKCMTMLEAIPTNTVIFEDSHVGRQAAVDSGAHLIPVKDETDLTMDKVEKAIKMLNSQKATTVPWKNKQMNILVPMAGAGTRFSRAGYTFPKPLIEVNGKPMIEVVVNNLNIDAHYIFIVQKQHYDQYNLKFLLNLIAPECDIICVDGATQGAACTTLLAKQIIDNDEPLLIVNSDQYVEWNSNETMYEFTASGIDGGILTFENHHPKWSYARVGENGLVEEVAEKKVISDNATVGIYYWNRGSDYVKYAEQMIEQDIRTNGEFYVCPVYNLAIADGKKIKIKKIDKMWGIGTPEDLRYFLERNQK